MEVENTREAEMLSITQQKLVMAEQLLINERTKQALEVQSL